MNNDWIPKRLRKQTQVKPTRPARKAKRDTMNDDIAWDEWEKIRENLREVDFSAWRDLIDQLEAEQFQTGPREGLKDNLLALNQLLDEVKANG